MDWFETTYWITGVAYQRGIGLVYLIAFLVARNQFPALLGERGLQPATRFLARSTFRTAPSLFHLHYSDRFFSGVVWTGIVLSALAALGVTDMGPIWLSMLTWLLLWFLYLSIVNVGQTFYGFGWESKLLEAGFFAIFLGPIWMEKPYVIVLLICWMLFRVELGAGLIKMRGDRCWRNLTCMLYHHQTQPMPNPMSWYFHQTPAWMHKTETLCNHIIQLGVVWFIFAPQPWASIAGILIIVSQLWLVQSGNYSWLNFLTIVVALPTISDGFVHSALGLSAPAVAMAPAWFNAVTYIVAALVLVLSIQPVKNLCSRHQLMNYCYNPFRLVNTYGAFGSVTRERREVVIQGTTDEVPGPDSEWREYEFKGKPTALDRRPPQVAPYHLRLDWQLWFVPLRPYGCPEWLEVFIRKLLENDSQVLKLIRTNPFPEKAPAHIRILMYRYEFTTREEKKRTGRWWKRTYLHEHVRPVNLRSLGQ